MGKLLKMKKRAPWWARLAHFAAQPCCTGRNREGSGGKRKKPSIHAGLRLIWYWGQSGGIVEAKWGQFYMMKLIHSLIYSCLSFAPIPEGFSAHLQSAGVRKVTDTPIKPVYEFSASLAARHSCGSASQAQHCGRGPKPHGQSE